MNRKRELEKEIYELEHNEGNAGRFQPKLIPLYREYQQIQKANMSKEMRNRRRR